MEEKMNRLKELIAEIADLNSALAVLGWDQQTYMPAKGAQDRADALGTLSYITQLKIINPEIGDLLSALEAETGSMDPDSDDVRMLKQARRAYDKQTRVPAEKVAEFTRVTSIGQEVWARARATNDFKLFQPHLEKIIELRREYSSFFAPYDHVYDPLLDDFEPGLKTADVQRIFNALRPQQVELIKAITSRPQVDDSFMHLTYPEKGQWDFGVEVITKFGYDWEGGRQDKSAHPFTTSFGFGDVRLTTRFIENMVGSALFSTMHEAGHGMYEQGFNPEYRRTALGGAASMAIHESQSRLWENLVGRSLPFWRYFYPRLQEIFPTQLGNVSLDVFYKAINKAEPSLIRVESDEATYNMHIMLRLELEIAMMEGSLQVKDLPEAWNERMREYLGVVPPNDAKGVLQDVHWSAGLIGYFPTYALGNLVSAQVWDAVHKDYPDLEAQIEKGEFSSLLGWLRSKIHVFGAKYEPKELIQMATGSDIDPQPYMKYLNEKYSQIYGF